MRDKTTGIISAIQELKNKILDVGGSKLVSQKSKVESVKLYLNLANEEITKAEVAKNKAEKDIKKYEGLIASNNTLLKETDDELETLDKQLAACKSILDDIHTKVEAAQSAEENAKEDLQGIKADLDEKTQGIQEFRKKEVRCKTRLRLFNGVDYFVRSSINRSSRTSRKKVLRMREQLCIGRKSTTSLSLRKLTLSKQRTVSSIYASVLMKHIASDEEEEPTRPTTENDQSDETPVKAEAQAHDPIISARSSTELHVYSIEELQTFTKKGLLGDATLLEGRDGSFVVVLPALLI